MRGVESRRERPALAAEHERLGGAARQALRLASCQPQAAGAGRFGSGELSGGGELHGAASVEQRIADLEKLVAHRNGA